MATPLLHPEDASVAARGLRTSGAVERWAAAEFERRAKQSPPRSPVGEALDEIIAEAVRAAIADERVKVVAYLRERCACSARAAAEYIETGDHTQPRKDGVITTAWYPPDVCDNAATGERCA